MSTAASGRAHQLTPDFAPLNPGWSPASEVRDTLQASSDWDFGQALVECVLTSGRTDSLGTSPGAHMLVGILAMM